MGSHSSRGRREQRRHRQEAEEGEGEVGLPGEVDREHSDCSLRMRGQDTGSARIKVYILVLYIVQCACTVGGSRYVIMGSIVVYLFTAGLDARD